jgi:hypothetical protein
MGSGFLELKDPRVMLELIAMVKLGVVRGSIDVIDVDRRYNLPEAADVAPPETSVAIPPPAENQSPKWRRSAHHQ